MPEFICLGVPYWIGDVPADSAVHRIQASDIAAQLGTEWITIEANRHDNEHPTTGVNRALAATIAMQRGKPPLVFSGDCMGALGVVAGLNKDALGILWLDAHGDFNTPETTPSGFLGGMPLAMLTGRGDMSLMHALDAKTIPDERIILSDARNLDPEEAQLLKNSGVRHIATVDDLLNSPLPSHPLYIHLDLDVVDAAELPAHAYPERKGASVAQIVALLRRVAAECDVRAVLVSGWDISHPTADHAAHLHAVRQMVLAFAP